MCVSEAVFALPAASVATLAGTLRLTVPLVVGVTVVVYIMLSAVVNAPTLAVAVLSANETSACSKPETASLNVNVISNAPFCATVGAETVTVGASISTVTVCVSEAMFWFTASSITVPFGILITTSPLAVGVIVPL